jgi:hypothetical protein
LTALGSTSLVQSTIFAWCHCPRFVRVLIPNRYKPPQAARRRTLILSALIGSRWGECCLPAIRNQLRELGVKVIAEDGSTAPCATTVATWNGGAARTRADSAGHDSDGHCRVVADLRASGAAGVPRWPFPSSGVTLSRRCAAFRRESISMHCMRRWTWEPMHASCV